LLADEFRYLFNIFLSDSHLVQHGYLNEAPIRQFLGEHLSRKVDHGNRLWLLCNAEIWYRMAVEGWSKDQMKDLLGSFEQSGEKNYAHA
jgi:hypothetical protein